MAHKKDPMKRFMIKARHDGNGCWIWTSNKLPSGYGLFKVGTRNYLTHRWFYEQLVGTVPSGLEIDHTCRVKSCVSLEHLEPVTHSENIRRSWGDSCIYGHPLSGENLYTAPSGQRNCRICTNRRSREYYARKRASRA